MGELNFCTIGDILKTTYESLIGDLSLDLKLPYLASRYFHNKVSAGIFHSLHCYFLYFDTRQLGRWVPLIFLPFILYAFLQPRWRKALIIIQLLMPVFFIFNPLRLDLTQRKDLFSLYYMVIGAVGIVKFIAKHTSHPVKQFP